MASHLVSTMPLSKPMLEYCQLDPQEQTSVNFFIEVKTFSLTNLYLKVSPANGVAILSRPQFVNWLCTYCSLKLNKLQLSPFITQSNITQYCAATTKVKQIMYWNHKRYQIAHQWGSMAWIYWYLVRYDSYNGTTLCFILIEAFSCNWFPGFCLWILQNIYIWVGCDSLYVLCQFM